MPVVPAALLLRHYESFPCTYPDVASAYEFVRGRHPVAASGAPYAARVLGCVAAVSAPCAPRVLGASTAPLFGLVGAVVREWVRGGEYGVLLHGNK